jgi:2-polyprenyl-3-methyl-5-hydroxy-6-metoxy-1,4-benzoquinol methylase
VIHGADPTRARPTVDDGILDEQLTYYRERAPEYDEWFLRQGRYRRSEADAIAWRREVDEVRGWLASLELRDLDVLELASGTGLWTEQLLASGASVTAVDAAPEMLAQLTARVDATRLRCIQADLFDWSPDRRYDAVVSCFFMSHVPDERFDAFLGLVHRSLVPGGRVFLLDGLREPTSAAKDHVLPDDGSQTMRRRLNDGREFTIVKRFRGDAELTSSCAARDLDVAVLRTTTYFQVVLGARR